MTIRFFILQAHYRSTMDFSNEALQAAEKGAQKLMKAVETIDKLKPSSKSSIDIKALKKKCYEAMDDDLNTPVLLSHLFEGLRCINSVADGCETVTEADINELRTLFNDFVFGIMGLQKESSQETGEELTSRLMEIIIGLRQDAKERKEWAVSDKIRDKLEKAGVTLKDTKEGTVWEVGP